MNAIGSYPVDRAAEAMGYKNTPSFWDRYHEIVDPTMEAINEYHKDKPVEAAGLELGAGVFNPANKVGVGFIKNGTSFANTALRSGVVGSGIGGVAGAMNAERVEDVVPNAFGGSLSGAAIGGALPLATGIAGKMIRPLFKTKKISQPSLNNMTADEILDRLRKIRPERYRDVVPQTGLTPDEYANIVLRQADELGVKVADGNPELVNSGVMHFVLDKNTGKTASRAPFVGTLKETYINPDITITQGNDKNYIGLLNNTLLGKQEIDNLVTRNNELYIKYQIRLRQLANKIQRSETDNLSISQNILNDMGISPSLEYANNITPNSVNVKKNTPNLKRIADFWNNYGRRYSPQYLTPYLAQIIAQNQ